MDILRAIIDGRAGALDDGVLRLLASELRKKPSAFKPRSGQPRRVHAKSAMLPRRQFKSRA